MARGVSRGVARGVARGATSWYQALRSRCISRVVVVANGTTKIAARDSKPDVEDRLGRRSGRVGHDSLREAALLDIMQREAAASPASPSSPSSPSSGRSLSDSPDASSAFGSSEAGAGRGSSGAANVAGAGESDAQVWFRGAAVGGGMGVRWGGVFKVEDTGGSHRSGIGRSRV